MEFTGKPAFINCYYLAQVRRDTCYIFKWKNICPPCPPLCVCESRSVVSDSLRPHELYSPWNFPGQNTGVGSYSLLQGIFPTQGSNPGLPHCRQILYQLSHNESTRILECVAYPFSRKSSWPRNWTGVPWIAGRFFTNWAIREAGYQGTRYSCTKFSLFKCWADAPKMTSSFISNLFPPHIKLP